MNEIYLIGLGFKPLQKELEDLLLEVPFIFSFSGTLKIFEKYPVYFQVKDKIKVVKSVEELISNLRGIKNSCAILASGDPLYFGLGNTLIKHLNGENIKIFPDLSTLQIASSKLKIPWYKIKSISFHGKFIEEDFLIKQVKENPYIAILTDSQNSASKIAEIFSFYDLNFVKFYVFERLGFEDERILEGKPVEIKEKEIKNPHFLIIENLYYKNECIFGLEEGEIFHERGMITKDEIRAIIIHKLKLPMEGIFWDIGAGSGSVSIEVAQLNKNLEVFAIERDKNLCEIISKNKKKFHLYNLKIVQGEAPDILKNLPPPQRIFIGGSGGKLKEILEFLKSLSSWKILILTAVTPETFFFSYHFFEEDKFIRQALQIQINRLTKIEKSEILKAQNPVFLIKIERI